MASISMDLGSRLTCRGYAARVWLGRVVELKVRRIADLEDLQSMHSAMVDALRRAGPGAVICGDLRRGVPLPRDVAGAWSRNMRMANGEIACSALLLDPANLMFNLQMERIVRCAINPQRRLFGDVDELRRWVARALTRAEGEALRGLFTEEDAP